MAVHKDCKKDITEEICKWMLKQGFFKSVVKNVFVASFGKGFSIDDGLLSKYPGIKETFINMQKAASNKERN